MAAIVSWISLDRPEATDSGAVPVAATMLRRGRSLAIVTLTNQVQLSADLLLVGVALGTAAAGDYYLAGQTLVAALLSANAAGQIALARLPALAGTPERFRANLAADMKRLSWFATVAALALAAAAPVLAPRLFGQEHVGAVTALLWLLPWFVLQHPTTLLQAALTAAAREGLVVAVFNIAAILVLLVGPALAVTGSGLAAFALARSAAEAVRVALLWFSLRPAGPGVAAAAPSSRGDVHLRHAFLDESRAFPQRAATNRYRVRR